MTFEPGQLLSLIDEVTERALASGALLPIATEAVTLEENGIRFVVRVLSNLVRKDEDRLKRAQEKRGNPFLPYEKELFVVDVSPTHLALLNKFNVMSRHLLIITRDFEEQEELLTAADFHALWQCMAEYDALGFYNGGEAAGASQQHKHLQLVPLPLTDRSPAIPVEPLFALNGPAGALSNVSAFPFRHSFCLLELDSAGRPRDPLLQYEVLYRKMLAELGMELPRRGERIRQSLPYCLLATRRWMLMVPRSEEYHEGISVNSLGYAGCLLVRKAEQLELIRKIGPLNLLRAVSLPC